jgi:hypothetical protein
MGNLASTYRNQGRWKEAEDLDVQVMESSLRVLGQEHLDALISMANLALIWKGNGRDIDALDIDALKLMKHCVEARARILGANHPYTLFSHTALLGWQTEEWEISALVDRE